MPVDRAAERARLQRAADGAFDAVDPLGPLLAYATFLAAHFPKDKQALYEFLRTATDSLKDRTELHNDPRCIDLWLLYASRVNRPLAVYSFLLKRRIGTGFARLFIEYGACLEKAGECVGRVVPRVTPTDGPPTPGAPRQSRCTAPASRARCSRCKSS
jgi:hypothetical protein